MALSIVISNIEQKLHIFGSVATVLPFDTEAEDAEAEEAEAEGGLNPEPRVSLRKSPRLKE